MAKANVNVNVDPVALSEYIKGNVNNGNNRQAFVKDLVNKAFYGAKEKYNVMVFNLEQDHEHKLNGVQYYESFTARDGTRFGVWVFQDGWFENKGHRGWQNWGMFGWFDEENGGNKRVFKW